MVEGTVTTTAACLATVRLYLWGTAVTQCGFSRLQCCGHKRVASLIYLDALWYQGLKLVELYLCPT
jgi:hypothetical protein